MSSKIHLFVGCIRKLFIAAALDGNYLFLISFLQLAVFELRHLQVPCAKQSTEKEKKKQKKLFIAWQSLYSGAEIILCGARQPTAFNKQIVC